MLNLAYETVLQSFYHQDELGRVIAALRVLADKTGLSGMLGGQGRDVANEKSGRPVQDEAELMLIYENKTAALLEASLMVGAILAGADKTDVERMEEIGHKIGLAFQVRDDIMDVISTQEEMGKPVRSDEKNEKTTYVTLFGTEAAQEQVETWTGEALQILETLPGDKAFLGALFAEMAGRRS